MEQIPSLPSAGNEPAPAADMSGRNLGEFHLLRRLGQGGMGEVYLAEQKSLKRKVAVKIMRPELAMDAVSFQRFKAEAEAVARVTHANIVQVYAFSEENGVHFMALEYVEGRNLREYLARKGTTDTALALSILRQVGAALGRAAELGIIHRDIKPENILLTKRGEVKVADFGLSRFARPDSSLPSLTQSGLAMGTPLYMSPEQVQGQPLDVRTDIYSLGVTCYQMLAGEPPFKGKTAFELATHHVNTAPRPLSDLRPDLAPEICALVHKMIAKDPASRFQNCGDLLREISRLREQLTGSRSRSGAHAIQTAVQPAGAPAAGEPVPVSTTEAVPTWTSSIRHALPPVSPLVAISVGVAVTIVALAGGAFLAWWRHDAAGRTPAVSKPLSSIDRQEKFLKESLEQDAVVDFTDRSRAQDHLRRGLTNRVELAQLYLKKRQLDDADQLFASLVASKVLQYRILGQLGQGLVLAYKDRPVESNDAIRKAWDKMANEAPMLRNNPSLRYEIARALDYNKSNLSANQSMGSELEALIMP